MHDNDSRECSLPKESTRLADGLEPCDRGELECCIQCGWYLSWLGW